MSSRTFEPFSRLTVAAGGVLFAIGNLLHPIDHSLASQASATWVPAHVIFTVGAIGLALGLPVLCVRRFAEPGRLGVLAIATLLLGIIGVVPAGFFEAFVSPAFGPESGEAFAQGGGGVFLASLGMLLPLGSVLFGAATVRARVFPRAAAVAIAVTGAALFVIAPLELPFAGLVIIACTAVWGASFAWIGLSRDGAPRLVASAPKLALQTS